MLVSAANRRRTRTNAAENTCASVFPCRTCVRHANTGRGAQRDEGRRGAASTSSSRATGGSSRSAGGRSASSASATLLRDPQPLPAPGRAAVPGADRAVGAVERARRLPAWTAEPTLLACPWHGWEYDLATGQSFLGPGEPRRQGLRRRRRARRARAGRPRARALRRRDVPGPRRGGLRCRRCLAPPRKPPPTEATERAVKLVDADIHPAPLPQLHRRAPRRAVPRALRALRRARRQPAADVPARAQPGLPRRLVARGRLPRQRLRPHARAAARRAQASTTGPHPAARPQLRRRGARVRRRAVPRRQRVDARGDARPRRAPARHDQHRARARPSSPCAEIERYAGDPRFVQVLLPEHAPSTRSATASTGRSTRPRPRPGCRSRSTPAASSSTAARAGRRTTSRSTSGTPTRWPQVTTSLICRGRVRALPRPAGRAASRPASRGRRPLHVVAWTPRGRRCATTCRTSTAGRRSSSASTSGSRRSRSRSPTTPSSLVQALEFAGMDRPDHVRHRLPALGLRLARRRRCRASRPQGAQGEDHGRQRLPAVRLRAHDAPPRATARIDCDVHVAPASIDALAAAHGRLLARLPRQRRAAALAQRSAAATRRPRPAPPQRRRRRCASRCSTRGACATPSSPA